MEFIGPPGAGKSAIASRLAERCGGTVVKVSGFDGGRVTAGERVRAVALHPGLAFAYGALGRQALSSVVNVCRRVGLMGRLEHDGSVFVEDGPFHALCRTVSDVGGAPNVRVARVVARLPEPDLLVAVRVVGETSLHRLAHLRGGNNRLLRMDRVEALAYVERYVAASEQVARILGGRALRVDNEKGLDAAVERVAAQLC